VTLVALVSVRLTRLPRGRCAACSRRRVLFTQRVEISGGTGHADSSHLCAECAGFARGSEPVSVDDAIAESPRTIERMTVLADLARAVGRIEGMGLADDPDVVAAIERYEAARVK